MYLSQLVFVFVYFFIFLDKCLEVQLLDHMVVLLLSISFIF